MNKVNAKYQKMFEPGYIGKMKLKNRTIMPAMGTVMANEDQSINQYYLDYHFARTDGEIGLQILEITSVEKRGQGLPSVPGIWSDKFIPGLARLVDGIHERGGKACVQLHHAGRGAYRTIIGEQGVGPSAIRAAGMKEAPRELSRNEVVEVIEAYGDGARRAQMAGYDCVEVHGGHGYMVWAFLSPLSNQRTDEYGGNFDNRFRFLEEIIKNIKSKCGKDYPIIVRLSASEDLPGGLELKDTLKIAKRMEEVGGDALHMTSGNFFDLGAIYKVISPMYVPHGFLLDETKEFKKVLNIPVIAVGGLTPEIAEKALEEGTADFVSFGRPVLADPDFVKKIKEGKLDEIRRCIRCNEGCIKEIFLYKHVKCSVNPAVGREAECIITPAINKKKIVIVGAGPGGMEAALIAGQRGHNVKLYEKTGELGGGQYKLAASIPGKEDLDSLVIYHNNMLKKYDNIDVIFNTNVDKNLIEKENPDIVIIATGGKAIVPKIKGIDNKNVITAFDVLARKANIGNSVIVVGGGLVGVETAHYLALEGKNVKVVEMMDDVATNLDFMTRFWLMEEMNKQGVEFLTKTKIKEFTDEGVIVTTNSDENEKELIADTVVVAVGVTSVNDLEEELKDIDADIYIIGDAKQGRKIISAISEGYHLARRL
ncbi:MAG: NADH:flavin oxidoreductase/NADH oxidase [Bacillota bacterium]|jgi:2,4-dienoyl-CoA reductase-like NADH-dependent reductase (Old Yellow Enzyme family)|nr:NADH:flavin oxidoreductase/NADH oxidase [Bacillota bacterium]